MRAVDEFDAAATAVPPAKSKSAVQLFDDASTPTPPPAPVAPASGADQFTMGLGDLGYKTAQVIQHVMPEGMRLTLDRFNKAIAEKTGAEYVPWDQVDARTDQREQAYDAARQAATPGGKPGFDWLRMAGNLANPLSVASMLMTGGGAATTLGRMAIGAGQGGASSVLASPTTGEDQKNFWQTQAKLGIYGALGGGGLTLAAEAASPAISKGATLLRNLLTTGGRDVTPEAERLAAQAFADKGIDPATVDPNMLSWFKGQVQQSLKSGATPDARTAANLAEAAALPVPVPLLKGQASRDPMKYAMEQNLRGITGVGEPITEVLGQQNRALIANLDAMGAKGAPNIVDAGAAAIRHLQNIDAQARASVTDAYNAFKSATGKSLDVPLQGVAQDYARVVHEFGSEVPSGIRNQFEALGLMTGKQAKTFSIEDAESLLKSINRQYDPSKKASAAALDDLRRSVQNAITDGAGGEAAGAEAAQLAQRARQLARARFGLIDSVPAYKAAISDVAPDKFIQRHIWNGNARDIASLKQLLGADPEVLNTVKSSVMGDLKNTALNGTSPENGIFSQAKYNGVVKDQNNAKRLAALFEPAEVQRLNSLGNVAEVVMVPPKAAAVNSSNTASAAANLVQGIQQGGVGTKALSTLGKAAIPVVSPLAGVAANRAGKTSLADLVRQSTQPLTSADLDALNFLTKRTGFLGGAAAGETQK